MPHTTFVYDDALLMRRRAKRMWVYPPQLYWYGWGALLPVTVGHDEYARRTIVVGWTVTGRVVIPLWDCGDPDCWARACEYASKEMSGAYNDMDDM